MRKIILILTAIIISASIYGQELSPDTSKKEFKNVIGLNMTNFLSQILFINTYDNYLYPYNYLSSPYMITFKRIFKKDAIRFGIGGNVSKSNNTNNDTAMGDEGKNHSLYIGLGYEHYGYITKNWTFYYGIDAIGSYTYSFSQYNHSSTYNEKSTTTTYSYGASPLFGLIFRFNKRISIATETSYDISFTHSKTDDINSRYPISNRHTKSTGLETQYHAPATIMIRIQF